MAIRVRQPYTRAHRHIAKTILGRPLTRDECVHHIDGNVKNNAPSNLIIMSRSYHQWLHWALIKRNPALRARRARLLSHNKTAEWAGYTPHAHAARQRKMHGARLNRSDDARRMWAKRTPEERAIIFNKMWTTRRLGAPPVVVPAKP